VTRQPEGADVSPPAGRTVVLGLGNVLLGDDGVGVAVATRCRQLLQEADVPGVDVLVSARGGFELIDLLHGYARAVILDCLESADPRPGTVRRLTLDGVAGSPRLIGAHDLSLGQAFRLAARLAIPMPSMVEILAIEGGDLRTLGAAMTPPVAAAVEPLARAICASLRREAVVPPPEDAEDFRRRRGIYAPDAQSI
jgi:hydrogenase maturation protease